MKRLQWRKPAITTGLGITTNSFEPALRRGEISHMELLQNLYAMGFSWVELRDQRVELTEQACSEISAEAKKLGMTIHYAWNNGDVHEKMPELDQALANAQIFGEGTCCRVVVAPGLLKDKSYYTEEELDPVLKGLEDMISKAQARGLRLCFENSMEGISGMETLYRHLPQMQSVFDAANMTAQVPWEQIDTEDLVAYYQRNQPRIPYFHLKTSENHSRPAPWIRENGDFCLGQLLTAFREDLLVCLELPAQQRLEDVVDHVQRSIAVLKRGGYLYE